MSCDKYARMIIKQGSGVPTIPASTDHRNGDWIATDIYEGELYQDTDTGWIYTRKGNDIVMTNGTFRTTYHVLLTQTSTNAPTVTDFNNNFGTITWSYIGVGVYKGTSVGSFPSDKTSVIMNTGGKLGYARAWRVDDDTIRVETYNTSFVVSNAILDQVPLIIEII